MHRREAVLRAVNDLEPLLVSLSRQLYDDPELGNEEFRAVEKLTAIAAEHGFEVEKGVAGLPTAFRAVFRGGNASSQGEGIGPTVAFMAEYDALPDIGHACGHNIIASSCLGAALALSKLGPDLPGNVVVMGCPAEETTGGKVALVDEGAFDGVDAAMSVHPGGRDGVGGSSRASHPLEIEFFGRASHAAAAPEEGANALQGLVLALNAIWSLKGQLRDDVRLPGIIVDGGSAPNVIPDYARARLSVRAADARYLTEVVIPRIRACAEGAAMATGTRAKCRHYEPLYKDLRQNEELNRLFKETLESLGRTDVEVRSPERRGGSTDVGNVSYVVPTIHPTVSIVPPGVEARAHTIQFAEATVSDTGVDGLLTSTRAMALTALRFMADRELQRRVAKAHKAWGGGAS